MTHLSRLQAAMKKRNFSAVALLQNENIFWTCGFHFDDGALLVFQNRAYLLTDGRYTEAASKQADPAFQIVEMKKRCADEIKELCRCEGAETIGVEFDTLSHAQFLAFQSAMPKSVFSDVSSVLKDLRTVKDESELSFIAEAQKITDAAFSHLLTVIKPEMTEKDVALELDCFMLKNGADGLAFDTIAVSGSHTSMPHGVPSDQKLQVGFLTLDFGAKYRGYCSDMTRTLVLGRADAEMKKMYQTVLSAQKDAIAFVGEGASCRESDAVARRVLDGAYPGRFGHSLGHGVGLYIHESPSLSPKAATESVLSRGNVFTVEPGVYVPDLYGVRIEDMLCIDVDGRVRDFTSSSKELIELF